MTARGAVRGPHGLAASVRRRAAGESGITLVELLVAIVLLGVLSTIVVGLYASTTRSIGMTSTMSLNTRSAANTMDELSRVVRSGSNNSLGGSVVQPAVQVAKKDSLTIISYVDTDAVNPRPTKVEFSLNGARELVEKRWVATPAADGLWEFPASAPVTSTRTLPGKIVAPSGLAPVYLFTYLKEDRVTAITPPDAGLSVAERELIAAIKVTVVVQASDAVGAEPVTVQNIVGLPNLDVTARTP